MTKKDFLIAVDLYSMRYLVKNKWYETHDVLRDYLLNKKYKVEYKKDDLVFQSISIKDFLKNIKQDDDKKVL